MKLEKEMVASMVKRTLANPNLSPSFEDDRDQPIDVPGPSVTKVMLVRTMLPQTVISAMPKCGSGREGEASEPLDE